MSGGRANGSESRGRRNGHVLVWEQPGLEENDKPVRKRRALVGTRHVVTFMIFLGMANAYVMRTNMSVAIVAMVNHTAITEHQEIVTNECQIDYTNSTTSDSSHKDGEFEWDTKKQGYLLSSFFYGYVITQIPFGILAKRYGSKYFLGVGMLINSLFGLLVPVSAHWGFPWLMVVRFIQGLGEGPIVPCTHALLAKWIPPNERSRMGAFVYAGAQFGTVISMPLSGLLSEYGFAGGWPSIFYVFGAVGTIWCIAFLIMVYEDPESHPHISEDEKKYILSALWGNAGASSPPVPWKSIVTSMPFWAILMAHMGQNYGYETLMTELPTFMKQILHFDIKSNGTVSSLPYLAMWIFSMLISHVADWMISTEKFNHTVTRKIINSIGQYGPAVALVAASYTGCNPWLTISLLTIGVGLNGGIYSGFKVNHLDISPRFAGVLMSFTNCLANLAGLLAPIIAGHIIVGTPTQHKWRIVFVISAAVYVVCATVYVIFGSGERQSWDNPDKDEEKNNSKELEGVKTVNETQH
ncbi:putative inorganic phosphate cotransporter isoform X2 [Vespula pensylvanica]|uniref:putative inorganic phosphate cotransporter isoform X2 n=2 Tax=Vespula pensylvanica TaxID=30213 RepID=UPI001CBA117F|nr:putative inorganic phosphate cotransporter isoform X2 [Vespula pensylvanica]XP_050859334.1 putative inorganic phosphate cotransporter isoform X1 [Vespula vulgaris]